MRTSRELPGLNEDRPMVLLPAAVLSIACFILVGSLLASAGLYGFAITEGLTFALVPMLAVAFAQRQLGATTRGRAAAPPLRRRARAVLGGALLGVAVSGINLLIIAPIATQWMSLEELQALERSLLPPDVPFVAILFILTIVPAVCEEYVFRGLFLRGLVPHTGRLVAVVVAAVGFGVMHGSLARALPTTVLGLACGWAALRTGQLAVPIAAHFTNNLLPLILAAGALPGLGEKIYLNAPAALGGLLALAGSAFLLIGRPVAAAPVQAPPEKYL